METVTITSPEGTFTGTPAQAARWLNDESMTPTAARALGREHGAAVPSDPADYEQARSDRTAAKDLHGASQEALDAYLEGHAEGQRAG